MAVFIEENLQDTSFSPSFLSINAFETK